MAQIDWVDREGPTGRTGYRVSNNVRVVAPDVADKTVIVRSGAYQAAEQNTGQSQARRAPSSPNRGANDGKPYPGTKTPATPTKLENINKATAKDEARALKAAKAAPKGTQAGHAVTTSENHIKPVASRGGGKAGGSIGDFGGGGMNWETK